MFEADVPHFTPPPPPSDHFTCQMDSKVEDHYLQKLSLRIELKWPPRDELLKVFKLPLPVTSNGTLKHRRHPSFCASQEHACIARNRNRSSKHSFMLLNTHAVALHSGGWIRVSVVSQGDSCLSAPESSPSSLGVRDGSAFCFSLSERLVCSAVGKGR